MNIETVLEEQFHFPVCGLEEAPRGFVADTYYVHTPSQRFFLKVFRNVRLAGNVPEAVKVQYQISRELPQKLLPEPQATTGGEFVFYVGRYPAVLYECLPGTASRSYELGAYFEALAQIHAYSLRLPVKRSLVEAFSLADKKQFQSYLHYFLCTNDLEGVELEARHLLQNYEGRLLRHWQQWQCHAEVCRQQAVTLCVTHGDGPGNVIEDGEALYIVDWDDLQWAPLERDTWFHADDPKEKELLQEVLDCHGLGPAFRSCFLHYYTYKRFFDDLLDFLEGICQSSEEAVKRDMLVGIRTDCFQWTYPLLPGLQ